MPYIMSIFFFLLSLGELVKKTVPPLFWRPNSTVALTLVPFKARRLG